MILSKNTMIKKCRRDENEEMKQEKYGKGRKERNLSSLWLTVEKIKDKIFTYSIPQIICNSIINKYVQKEKRVKQ